MRIIYFYEENRFHKNVRRHRIRLSENAEHDGVRVFIQSIYKISTIWSIPVVCIGLIGSHTLM